MTCSNEDFVSQWRALGRSGFFAPFAAEDGLEEGARALEALAYEHKELGIFISIVSGCGLALPILAAHRDDARRRRVVRGEEIVAVAITEPHAGSDVLAMTTTLRQTERGLVLSGGKWSITNAPVADTFVVFAQYESEGARFLCAVVVPAETPGVVRSDPLRLAGAKGSPTGAVFFEDVAVDPAWIVERPDAGRRLLEGAFVRERLLAPWPLIGRTSRALQEAIDRVETRHQFGRPIKTFQYVQEKIVSSYERLETTRLLAQEALDRFTRGEDASAHASLAKYHAAECASATFKALIEIYGAAGVMAEAGLTDGLVDAVTASIAGGTRESHKKLLFQQLVLDRARARRAGRSRLFRNTHTAATGGSSK